MVARIGTAAAAGNIDSILKDYYLGPLQKQLNNEVMALEMFQKMAVDWNGRRVVIPLHIARSTGAVAYNSEADTLPAADVQGYEHLSVHARFMYGRFEVSGPAMASAAKGGKNSFIAALEGEMSGLKDDIRDRANIACFAGGRVKGFLNEHKLAPNNTTGVAAQDGVGNVNPGENVYEFSGDFTPFLGVTAGELNSSSWVRIRLFQLDGTEIFSGGNDDALFVSAIDQPNQTITIAHVTSDAGAAAAADTSAADTGDAVIVALHPTQYVGTAGNIGTVVAFGDEPIGIYGNLADPEWHGAALGGAIAGSGGGIDRSAAANAILRCPTIKTCNRAGDHSRVSLQLGHIQAVFDEVLLESDSEPDCMIINPIARQRYISLLQGVINSNADTVTKGDGGFKSQNLGYGGVKFKVSRHCGRSMIVGLTVKKWKLLELQAGEFADLDGAVLSRVANRDSWEGFYRWYYNMVCLRPNCNFILVGFTIV